MKFKVESLRLQESKWGGQYLAIDFNDCISMGIPISKERAIEIRRVIKEHVPDLVIEE